MPITIRSPETEEECRHYYHLRWQLLRAPWGEPEGSEKDALEPQSHHFIAVSDKQKAHTGIVGIARLQFNSREEAQIRYMAVIPAFQRMGTGSKLIAAMEKLAGEHQCQYIALDARENAVAFYQALGYRIETKSYLLFNEIQHYRMLKLISDKHCK